MFTEDTVKDFQEKWNNLEHSKRQNIVKYGSIIVILLFIVSIYYISGRDEERIQNEIKQEPIDIIEVGESRLEDDIRYQISKEREEINKRQLTQEEELAIQMKEMKRHSEELESMKSAIDMLTANSAGNSEIDSTGIRIPKSDISDSNQIIEIYDENEEEINREIIVGNIGRLRFSSDTKESILKDKKKDNKFYLPVSFMPAQVLTGLRAKTVSGASESPEPILLRVQAPAILPNDLRKNLMGCLVVAHGYGDLSSERIETKLVSLNCLNHSGELAIEEEITGIILDKDSIKGLAAKPVSKMGTNLARIAMVGVVSGVGETLSFGSQTSSISPFGKTQSIEPSKIGKSILGKSVSSAATEYSRILSDLIRQQAPVLEMGADKEVTIVITEGVWLNVQDHLTHKINKVKKNLKNKKDKLRNIKNNLNYKS